MKNNIQVTSICPDDIKQDYDLILCTIGFEARARHAISKLQRFATSKIAICFRDRQVLDFDENLQYFKKNGFTIVEDNSDVCSLIFSNFLSENKSRANFKFLIDVSSMTRNHIASICYESVAAAQKLNVTIILDFIYSHALYSPPPLEFGPIQFRGPVLPEFSGWSPQLELPTAIVFGLGYEPDVVLGLAEELEPGKIILFKPSQHDNRYTKAIEKSNCEIIDKVPKEICFEYSVFDWYLVFVRLTNVITGLYGNSRVTLVPFGPKIFSVCCILSGLDWYPFVSVWRVSPAEYGNPVNRFANGIMSCLRARIAPPCVRDTDSTFDFDYAGSGQGNLNV